MQDSPILKRHGAYLPHWTRENGIYHICFRLADSASQKKLRQWKAAREDLQQVAMQQKRPFTEWERKEWMRLHSEAIEQYLQKGRGSCWLRNTTIVEIVTGALRFFEGTKFRLYAWCIMPNHVHVIMQPLGNYSVSSILHSWKTFSAKEANKVLNRNGRFWHAEYFDKLIRSEEQLRICIRYVWDNPEKAGWSEWKWRWKIREDQLLDRNTGL